MGEVAQPSAANLPDAVIGPLPHLLEMIDDAHENGPGFLGCFKPRLAGGIETAESFAVDVDLERIPRTIANADGTGLLVARKPVEFQLVEPPLAGNAVHDLKPRWISCHRTRQPVAERCRLVLVAA